MKTYEVILVDPPWKYSNTTVVNASQKAIAQNHYSVLEVADIKKLPVQKLAAKDACIFLWVTTPFLGAGFEVLDSWNFEYKTSIYWVKTSGAGFGFWFKNRVEVCLFGIRGKVPAFKSKIKNIIQAPVTKHSVKPGEMYNIIEGVSSGNKLELFARAARPGWDSWGNELDCSVNLPILKEFYENIGM